MGRKKFYAVVEGNMPGVYDNWEACREQVSGFSNAQYKGFATLEDACGYFEENTGDCPCAFAYPLPYCDDCNPPAERAMWPAFDDFVPYHAGSSRVREFPSSFIDPFGNTVKTSSSSSRAVEAPIVVYTDGSSRGNGKFGATAGYGVWFGPDDARNIAARLQGPRQTNQRAELTAINEALNAVSEDKSVTIKTDSQYAIDCLTKWHQTWARNGWKNSQRKDVENKDLIQWALEKIRQRSGDTHLVKVAAHTGEIGNEMADKLANQGALKHF